MTSLRKNYNKVLYRTFLNWDAAEAQNADYLLLISEKSAFFSVQKGFCTVENNKEKHYD